MVKTIGLFGGTFDPVHNGHIAIAQSFLQSKIIKELWILLTPYPPHKNDRDHTSYSIRLKMLETAFSNVKKTKILTIENELPQPSYSINTIKYLKQSHPDIMFYFCIGEDNLAHFHNWKSYSEILDEVKLLVVGRPKSDHSKVDTKILEKTIFVEHQPIAVSSSEIKDKLVLNESVQELLPPKVLDIIHDQSLYKSQS